MPAANAEGDDKDLNQVCINIHHVNTFNISK
jgi:hypothetical protein